MRFWKSIPGVALITVLALVTAVCVTVLVRVWSVTHPARRVEPLGELTTALARVEEVRFPAADGVSLAGWLLEGRPDRAAILLCHDLGASKGSVLNLGLRLQRDGFTALAFDFRGHGESDGAGSGLGIPEKRDIIGAVDFLAAPDENGERRSRFGAYGVGMGAYAVVRAARDRPDLRVLVLDGLYPETAFLLEREVYGGWRAGQSYLGFLPRGAHALIAGRDWADADPAREILPRLPGRDLLLVAPAGDVRLAHAMEAMYRTIPEQEDADGNLITLPATGSGTLFGEDLDLYHDRIAGFFVSRLSPLVVRGESR